MASYPGGKSGSGVYQQIINQIPPHRVYVEPFLGGGGVLKHKRPALINIGLDTNPEVTKMWAAVIAEKRDISDRLVSALTVKNCDAISFLKSYAWKGDEFVYCDPPYLLDTRSSKQLMYACEFETEAQHTELLKVLLSLPCKVAISGYWSSLYSAMLPAWRTIHYQTITRGGTLVTEYLWMNYPVPLELHDYRYLGNNFRERERLGRIKHNMYQKFSRMDTLERYAVLSSIAEFIDGAVSQ